MKTNPDHIRGQQCRQASDVGACLQAIANSGIASKLAPYNLHRRGSNIQSSLAFMSVIQVQRKPLTFAERT